MRKVFALLAVIALLGSSIAARATITIDTVTVGDPGNTGELSGAGAGVYGPDRICGSVSYTYNIGKHEVTAGQYCTFLNAVAKTDTYGLYSTKMTNAWGCNIQRIGDSGSYSYTVGNGSQADLTQWGDRPVNYVSYWDACRFANWLNNGQGNGDTETGAYTLNGYNGDDGRTIQRNPGALWFLPSEDEWYKAAYYKGEGTNAGYWDYPTQNNTAPGNVGADGYADPGNHANYAAGTYPNNTYTIGPPYWRTSVGEFENSSSRYGTFDQGGNVWEWADDVVAGSSRSARGGYFHSLADTLHASYRGYQSPSYEGDVIGTMGFRVAGAVPEPSSFLALAGGLGCLFPLIRRRR